MWIYDERNGTWIPEEANASLIVSQKTYGWSPLDLNLLGIYPKPDFVPSRMEMPRTLYLGRQIHVYVTIENRGYVGTNANVSLYVRRSIEGGAVENFSLQDFGTVYLPPVGNASLTLKWLAADYGLYEILVSVDDGNFVDELDETNNNLSEERKVVRGRVIDVPRDFPTVREAVEDAAPGTVIYVHDGTYLGFTVENKHNITIIGEGWNVFVKGINIKNSSDITIKNFTIRFTSPGSYNCEEVDKLLSITDSERITIDNCRIYSDGQPNINIINSSHCIISNSILYLLSLIHI